MQVELMFIAHHILVPMDLTNLNRHALAVALQAIPADGEAATIHLVHSLRSLEPALKRRIVSAPNESFVEDAIRADEAAMLEVLDAAQAEVAEPARPNLEVIAHVVAVDLASACLALCDEVEVDGRTYELRPFLRRITRHVEPAILLKWPINDASVIALLRAWAEAGPWSG